VVADTVRIGADARAGRMLEVVRNGPASTFVVAGVDLMIPCGSSMAVAANDDGLAIPTCSDFVIPVTSDGAFFANFEIGKLDKEVGGMDKHAMTVEHVDSIVLSVVLEEITGVGDAINVAGDRISGVEASAAPLAIRLPPHRTDPVLASFMVILTWRH
jgi:hypothetical protein